jgi:sec-independent protein translocase protein TatA
MGGFSWVHWVVVLLVIVLLFGAGRISGVMGDLGKGLKSFKKGMADDDDDVAKAKPQSRITDERPSEAASGPVAQPAADRDKA